VYDEAFVMSVCPRTPSVAYCREAEEVWRGLDKMTRFLKELEESEERSASMRSANRRMGIKEARWKLPSSRRYRLADERTEVMRWDGRIVERSASGHSVDLDAQECISTDEI